jgi:hypothetical protein
VLVTIIEILLLCQPPLSTADFVEGKLAIEFIDHFDKHHVEVCYYLRHLNTSRQWLKLKPQSGFGIFRGLRSGDYIQVTGDYDLFSDKPQFLVNEIKKGAFLSKNSFLSSQFRS